MQRRCRCRGAEVQRCRGAEAQSALEQRSRGAEVQRCRGTEVQRPETGVGLVAQVQVESRNAGAVKVGKCR